MRKGIMEYFHISKAGGTSWCHAASGCPACRMGESGMNRGGVPCDGQLQPPYHGAGACIAWSGSSSSSAAASERGTCPVKAWYRYHVRT